MRKSGVIGTLIILSLLLGTAALAGAQRGRDDGRDSDKDHGDKHQDGRGSGKDHGNKHQNEHERSSGPQRADRSHENGQAQRHEERVRDQRAEHGRPEWQQPHGRPPEHARGPERREFEHPREHREVWESHRAQHWEREHHGWRERGGYRGYFIPRERFHAHFGREHWFRVHSAPILVVGGYPRFQYGGFWFSVVDPWPEYWSRNWYETDDVYIDYVNDGYYMYNRRHPGVAIAINVSL